MVANKTSFKKKIKIVLMGDSSVGKSNLLNRFVNSNFNPYSKATVGIEFSSDIIVLENEKDENGEPVQIKLQLWDTAGQEKYNSMIDAYFRNADGAVLLVDSTLPKIIAFRNSQKWIDDLKKANFNTNTDILVCMAISKVDLIESRELCDKDITEMSETFNVKTYLTSSLTGANIREMIMEMCTNIYRKSMENGKIVVDQSIIEKSNLRQLEIVPSVSLLKDSEQTYNNNSIEDERSTSLMCCNF